MSTRSNVVITMVKADYDKMVSLAQDTGDKDIIAIVTTVPEEVDTFVGVDFDGNDIELTNPAEKAPTFRYGDESARQAWRFWKILL